jgi:RNA polymerase sigma factor (sigma-70 family)
MATSFDPSRDDRPIDERSVERLYREHRASLCAYVRRKFGAGPPDPEEIAQEAFARLARKSGETVPNPKAFLMITARNVAIDAHRRQKNGQVAIETVRVAENSHDLDASDVLSSRQELERLASIVDTLKPKQRAAFLMHRLDGLSFAEIARRMGISQSGARLLVETALATCVARMEKSEGKGWRR